MQVLPTTTDEAGRLADLAEFETLDTPAEGLFDAFTRLAATCCGTPIALISLVDDRRAWFKSAYGWPGPGEAPRDIAFCDHAIRQTDVMEVPDATLDVRFACNPLVVDEPKIRFYAAAPLISHRGAALGTLAVMDYDPRTLTDSQRAVLVQIASTVVEQLEARRTRLRERAPADERDAQLAVRNERLTALTAIARSIFAALDPAGVVEALIAGTHDLIGGEARLLVAIPGGGFSVTRDLSVPEAATVESDAFLEAAAADGVPLLADGERRGAVRVPGTLGETRYLLDVRSAEPLQTADVFALGLLAQYFAVAARNVELYGELQARRAAVVEANQVKNDLIAMLAHDFKGPLTTIVGFADVLAEDDRFDDESRKFLAMISSSAMRLASLATDTLALSRLEQNELTLNIEEFDLVALVRDIVRVFIVTRPITLTSDPPVLVVAADPARLRQVFENLIGNAIKYSPGGEPIEIRMRENGRGVEVSVRDHGIGIPAADRPKLFGRFARAQNARAMGIGGTGFGLYLTKTIVEMHGGTIGVESREGRGSTFRVFVPSSVAVTRPQRRRFVVLDPAGDARSYSAQTLRDDGYGATVVADGKALLEQVDETQFDAALIDTERVGMPLPEFVRRVAGRTALIRIDAVPVEESPGWDGYLVKPFLTNDLRAAIEAAIKRHPRRKPDAVLSYSAATGT